MTVDLSEFVSGFLAEADDHLRSIHSNLMLVDKAVQLRSPNPRAVRELFRSLHTMKGLAAMVGVEPIVEIAHSMERVLRDADQSGGWLPGQAFEPLLSGTKAITQRVNALASGKLVADPPADLLAALDAIDTHAVEGPANPPTLLLDASVLSKLNGSDKEQLANPGAGSRSFQLSFTPSPERAARGLTITAVRERLTSIAEIVKVLPAGGGAAAIRFLFLVVSAASEQELAAVTECSLEEVVPIAQPKKAVVLADEPAEVEGSLSGAAGMLRVDVRRVDAAMDALGELLVTRFRLSRAVAELKDKGVDVRGLQEIVLDTQRRLRDVRALVLGLRMISLSELLERLPILVRGLQTTTGKPVQLRVDAGNAEIDKGVGERLWPVLVHLIRNAIDHGLESADERARAGKPKQGTILVSCVRTSNSQIEISIEDDGGGVNAEQVASRAGRPIPGDDAGLLELITQPGLSTRDAATATSGRGMGLDIVRRIVVGELGGELGLRTRLGQGTCFTLKVPVTVAVVDAFRFKSAEQHFLVPVSTVEELVEVEPAEVVSAPVMGPASASAALFTRRGKTMPFLELGDLVGVPGGGRSKKAIIVRRNDQYFAFGVERLIDHHEVIVRRLTDPLVDVAGVAGAADLGDGQPTLLLDLVGLARVHGDTERAA